MRVLGSEGARYDGIGLHVVDEAGAHAAVLVGVESGEERVWCVHDSYAGKATESPDSDGVKREFRHAAHQALGQARFRAIQVRTLEYSCGIELAPSVSTLPQVDRDDMVAFNAREKTKAKQARVNLSR